MKPSLLRQALPGVITARRPVFLQGDPGVGKSELVQAVANDMGRQLVDMRLSLYDPTALMGFPYIGKNPDGGMRFIPPALLPRSGTGILLLDELPAATPAVKAAAYQLILDRRINEYVLPDGWDIIAAGNFAHNGGVYYEMPQALANRFVHVKFDVDHDDWDMWAAETGISPIIRAFLRMRPALLHDISARGTSLAFPTPRSWKFVHDLIVQKMPRVMEFELIAGTVGAGPATEFIAMLDAANELPSAEEIFEAPSKAALPRSPGARYAVVTMLEHYATKENIGACLEYLQRLEKEFQTMFMNSIGRPGGRQDLLATKESLAWCRENQQYIL